MPASDHFLRLPSGACAVKAMIGVRAADWDSLRRMRGCGLAAVHNRHFYIHQNCVEAALGKSFYGLAAASSDCYAMPALL